MKHSSSNKNEDIVVHSEEDKMDFQDELNALNIPSIPSNSNYGTAAINALHRMKKANS